MIHVAIGIRQYGRAEPQPNGSFVTTEWFHVCFFPVYPLRRIRVTPQHGRFLVQELPKSAANIIGTYLFAVGYLAWLCVSFWFIFGRHSAYLDSQVGLWFAFVGVAIAAGLPFGVIWLMRWEALRSRYGEKKG